jgi:hypothetical protein
MRRASAGLPLGSLKAGDSSERSTIRLPFELGLTLVASERAQEERLRRDVDRQQNKA